jgi:hypothetical protein
VIIFGALGLWAHIVFQTKGNLLPKNPALATLTMPDFSENPGGLSAGASASNKEMAPVVIKEYATGEVCLTATTSTLFTLKLRD